MITRCCLLSRQQVARRLMVLPRNGAHNRTTSLRGFIASSASILFSTTHSQQQHDDDEEEPLGPNPGLASVIAQGQASLERSAALVAKLTRQSNTHSKQEKDVSQLAEAQRIESAVNEALDDLVLNSLAAAASLQVGGEPIVVLHVDVNRTRRLAKVHWCLPYGVLLDPDVTRNVYQRLKETVQERLVQDGTSILSKAVHGRLQSYYPPRLRLVPATDAMVQQALEETMGE